MRRLFKVGADRHDAGRVTFSWNPEGNFLASAGRNGIVQITDRHGEIIEEISMTMQAPILSLAWDKDGEHLAILQDGNSVIPLWNSKTRRVIPVEANLRDPTLLSWSKTGPQLAVGTLKGNVLLYNKTTKKKIPIVGKHAKRISCGAWSASGNKLVLGSEDKTITISNENGDTLLHTEVKHVPVESTFTNSRGWGDPRAQKNEDDIVSASLDGKSLLLFNIMDEKEEPMEISFLANDENTSMYGDIRHHEWFEDGMVIIGYSLGYLIVVSTNPREMGQKKFSAKFHSGNLISFAYNPHLKRVASAGDDGVRIIDLRDFRESKGDFIPTSDLEDGRINSIEWSPDGQILTVGTNSGNVYNFLAKMNALSARYKATAAYLSSLREISVVNVARRARPIDITARLEPALIALGENHVAAGMNNRVFYHSLGNNGTEPGTVVFEQEYMGTLRDMQLNSTFAVVLTDSKAILHPIEHTRENQDQIKTFPSREEGSFSRVTCIALTDDFLYYGTEGGTVEMFYLSEWTLLAGAELRLDNGIKAIHPNPAGIRAVVIDNLNQAFLFNPVTGGGVNQSIVRFEFAPSAVTTVVWDQIDQHVVMLFDGKLLHTYVYIQSSMNGTALSKLGPLKISSEGAVSMEANAVELAASSIPLTSVQGVLTLQTMSGHLSTMVHPLFEHITETTAAMAIATGTKKRSTPLEDEKSDGVTLTNRFGQCIALLKLETAWQTALQLDRRPFWLALSGKAMELLEIELAIRVYRQLGDAGMVMSLIRLIYVEDKNLLAGNICMLFEDYDRAQELFLTSGQPTAALQMRRDLLQWDQALKLAHALSSGQIPEICVKYGQQLELRGETEQALRMFDSALHEVDSTGNSACPEALVPVAMMGVARCNLRMGNIRQGLRLANELEDRQLFIDCGEILEQQKQYSDAVTMHIKGEQWERAAYVYTKYLIKSDKNRISEAAAIMERVQNDQLNAAFGKACIVATRYEDACRAFERANDFDKVVEIKLRNLEQVQQAFDLVRQRRSAQGAQLVADYCVEVSDFRGAIEFLLLANRSEEAFKLAQAQSLVDVYTSFLGDQMGAEEALKVAHFYEKAQDFGKAGRFYALCGHYPRALKLFIQCGDREIDAAIDVVGKSQSESLTHQLIDFLVGEKDGVPKDPNYIYRLYMALKKYEDAAKTALIIARQEQDMGNYPLAHSVVAETIRSLEGAGIKVMSQLRQSFVLLHSYLLVKPMVRDGNHIGAARLLLRVAQSVSKFPQHVVPILASTVIECQRAGMKVSAHEYAVILMRPEYRSSIGDDKLKRKIEGIVRRRNDNEEAQEDTSICPISGQPIPNYQLECPTTRDALPMCIISGRHMVLEDWCFCPNSKCTALYSEYVRYITSEERGLQATSSPTSDGRQPASAVDPVVGKPITVSDLTLAKPEECLEYIKRYNNVFDEKKKKVGFSDGGEDGEAKEGSTPKDAEEGAVTTTSENLNTLSLNAGKQNHGLPGKKSVNINVNVGSGNGGPGATGASMKTNAPSPRSKRRAPGQLQ